MILSLHPRTTVALATLTGLAVVAFAVAAVALFGISIDASRWRDALAARATAALGAQVRLDGPLELVLGREILLRARDLRVLNPPGFAAPELATLGAAEIRVDLLAALRGRLHVRSVALADGRVRFARSAGGGANWALPQRAAGPPAAAPGPVAIELERLSIRNLAVEFQSARADVRRVLDLDELDGIGESDGPLQVALRGRVRGSVPCALALEGASARLLHEGNAPWPFTLDLECPHTRLHASGMLDAGRRAARFRFGAGTASLAEVGGLLEQELPELGAAALAGRIVATADAIEVADLNGVLGDSAFAGGLVLGLGGARPRLAGELAIDTLDLRPLLQAERRQPDAPLTYDELAQQPLPLRGSVPVDADLVLRVQRLLGLPGDVRDARLEVHADERGVRSPIGATVAGVPLEGRIALDVAASTPALALEIGARDVPLAGLAEIFGGATGVDGRLGRLALRLGGRGETLGALVRGLELRLEVAAARLRYGGFAGRPVELTLDALELAVPRGQTLRGSGRGTLLGEPVRLAIRGGELPQLLREDAAPVELELAAARATARFSVAPARPEAGRGTDLAFRFDAPRAGGLARWVSVAPESKLPVALRGRLRIDGDHWQLEGATLKLGRSELAVDAQRVVIDGKPVAVVAVRSPLIDVPELETLRTKATGTPPRRVAASIDVPLLPQGIDLADADIGFGLARIVLGRGALADVGFLARIRDGRLPPSPYAARFAGIPFAGLAALDLRGAVPEAALSMSAEEVDVGALLRALGMAEIIDERAATLQVELASRGSVLGDLLEHASLTARVTGGDLTVRGPARRPVASLRIKEALVAARPGEPVTVRLDGALDDTPATVKVSSGTLADLARATAGVPFAVEASAAGARLALAGEVALPLGRGGELTLELAGERLDSLSGLAGVELPPWGPWSIRGPIAMTPTGYEVTRLTVRVGESRLYGTGRLDLTGPRPRLDARISAPQVQLDDFPYEARPGPGTVRELRARARDAAGQTEALLSKAFLARFDALVDVQVQQVLSGADRLADGKLHARLDGGRLLIDPIEVNVPGGGVRLRASYDTAGREVALAISARIERFEYGILARRLRPGTDLGGAFSLDMALEGKAPSLEAIMTHADGHFDFAVWPNKLRSGVFDRWSVNMFLAVLPFLDPGALLPFVEPGTESRVNCFVGRLDLKDGTLNHDALVIDTTRVRARGAGTANFRTEKIAFRFRPRAKGVTFFSLQTPLSVSGTMTDFTVRPSPGDVFEAIARLFADVVVVPLEILFRGPLPRDGADVCTDPLRVREPAK